MRKLAFLLSIIIIGILSCEDDDPKPAKLTSIMVKTAPTKTEYFEGDILDLSGLVITLTMDDNTTEDISYLSFTSEGISCSPANGSELSATSTSITITHTSSGKITNQLITVSEIKVSNITIKTAPTKTEYFENDILDLSGLVITLTMNDSTTEDISYLSFTSEGISCSPANGSELSATTTSIAIIHTSTGKITNQLITVSEIGVCNIIIKTAPTKVEYYIGENLDLSGLIMILSMNNGKTEEVSFSDFASQGITCTPENGSKLSLTSTEVIIEHTETSLSKNQVITFFKLTDIDYNTYPLVKIGNQIWMAENLRTKHYADGTPIMLKENNWKSLIYTDKAYCFYDNSTTNEEDYGALYTWAAAMNGEISSSDNPRNIQGACPYGWHLSSDDEWKELELYLGMDRAELDLIDTRGTDQGSKLAGIGNLWTDGVLENNANFGISCFLALPGGYRSSAGIFYDLGDGARFWSSTEIDNTDAILRYLKNTESTVGRDVSSKIHGRSVRCIKD